MISEEAKSGLGRRFSMKWGEVDRALKMFPDCDPALACTQWKAQHNAKRKVQRRNRIFMRQLAEGMAANIQPRTSEFEPECRQHPDMWFSNDLFIMEQAQAVCSRCPLQLECLRTSIEKQERYGMWGGLDERRRLPLIREHLRKIQGDLWAAEEDEAA